MYADRSNKNNVFELVTSNIATGLKWFLFLDENISHSRPRCDENPEFRSPSNFWGSFTLRTITQPFLDFTKCLKIIQFYLTQLL